MSADQSAQPDPTALDGQLRALSASKPAFAALSIAARRVLVEACARGIREVAEEWVQTACRAKAIRDTGAGVAEEITAGPMAVVRFLRLLRGTLAAPQSGIGWVHYVYLLDQAETTVLEGPLVVRPKPLWFPTHRNAERLARRVLALSESPAWWKLPAVLTAALRG